MRIPGFADLSPVAVAKEAVKDFFADDMLTYAAALAYHLLLALFPFVIFLLALLGSAGLDQFFDDVLQQADQVAPDRVLGRASGVDVGDDLDGYAQAARDALIIGLGQPAQAGEHHAEVNLGLAIEVKR